MADSLTTPNTKNPSKRKSKSKIPHPKRPKPEVSTNKHPQSILDDGKTDPAKEPKFTSVMRRNMSQPLDSVEKQLDPLYELIDRDDFPNLYDWLDSLHRVAGWLKKMREEDEKLLR
ncbi:MAG: hypothetical protein Q9228_004419, partial [Teloschistes exilis]